MRLAGRVGSFGQNFASSLEQRRAGFNKGQGKGGKGERGGGDVGIGRTKKTRWQSAAEGRRG